MADRAGRLKDRPPVIRATLFPFEAAVDAEALLSALARAGFITRYEVRGIKCIEVVHFTTHQSPHPHEIPSKLPAARKCHGSAVTSNGTAALVLDLDLDPDPDTDKGDRTSRAIAVPPADDFAVFWHAYPKKTGKAAALKAWQKAKPPIAQVLQALAWQTDSLQWNRDDGRYRPNPATYLNQGRWQDEPEQPAHHVADQKSRTGDTVTAARSYLEDVLRGKS